MVAAAVAAVATAGLVMGVLSFFVPPFRFGLEAGQAAQGARLDATEAALAEAVLRCDGAAPSDLDILRWNGSAACWQPTVLPADVDVVNLLCPNQTLATGDLVVYDAAGECYLAIPPAADPVSMCPGDVPTEGEVLRYDGGSGCYRTVASLVLLEAWACALPIPAGSVLAWNGSCLDAVPLADLDQGAAVAALEAGAANATARLDGLDADVAALGGRIEGLESNLTALEGSVAANEVDIGSLGSNLTALDGRVAATEAGIGSLDSNLTALEGRVAANEADVGSLESNLTALGVRVDDAEADIGALESNLTALDGRVAAVEADASALESNLTTLEGRVATNEADLALVDTRLRTSVCATMASNFVLTDGLASLPVIYNGIRYERGESVYNTTTGVFTHAGPTAEFYLVTATARLQTGGAGYARLWIISGSDLVYNEVSSTVAAFLTPTVTTVALVPPGGTITVNALQNTGGDVTLVTNDGFNVVCIRSLGLDY